MKKSIKSLLPNKEIIILAALMNFILLPLWGLIGALPGQLVTVISFSLVIFASFNAAKNKVFKFGILINGIILLAIIWIEFTSYFQFDFGLARMIVSLMLFVLFFLNLLINVTEAEKIKLSVIFNIMSGFLLLGIIGGILFELLDYHTPDCLEFTAHKSTYSFYYFSFINLTSVGFGDIIPKTSQAQAITLLIGVIGQFYLAFGVSVFVGKYLNQKNEP